MQAIINKFLGLEKQKDSIQFWILLGPLFLSLSLFLSTFSLVSNKDLFGLVIVGLWLCLVKRSKGLLYTLSLLLVLIVIKHWNLSHHLWQFGLEMSIAFGFIISYISFDFATDLVGSLNFSNTKFNQEILVLKEELNKERDFHQRQHKNFKFEMERLNLQLEEKISESNSLKELAQNLRELIKENEKEKEKILSSIKEKDKYLLSLRQEIEDMKEQILTLEDQDALQLRNKELLDELNNCRVEKEQGLSINQSLAKMVSDETELRRQKEEELKNVLEHLSASERTIASLYNDINLLKKELSIPQNLSSQMKEEDKQLLAKYEKKIMELKKIESFYRELKTQFEDKKRVLDETRKELFLTREKMEEYKKEQELQLLDENSQLVQIEKKMGSYAEEIVRIEDENFQLQELVTALVKKDNLNKKLASTDMQLPLDL